MDPQQQQQPPPYFTGSSSSYPTKQGGQPMQPGYSTTNPGYPANPGCIATTSGYIQHPPTMTTTTTRTVVQQQPPIIVTPGFMFGELPVSMQCPTCKTQIVTATEYAPGTLSWLACCGLAAVGCVLGCCFIPFCVDDMKDVTHTCPNCRVILGVYHRI